MKVVFSIGGIYFADADRLIVVTSVDSGYDADPHIYQDAKKYDRLTADTNI